MTSRNAIAGLLLCALVGSVPAAAPPTEPEPERLLPAGCLAYVRWDGVKRHQEAYKHSAFGKVVSEGLGRSARKMWQKAETELKVQSVGEQLLDGAAPDSLRRRHDMMNAVMALPEALADTGFIAGLEVSVVPPAGEIIGRLGKLFSGKRDAGAAATPHVQLTLVFPGAKGRPEVLAALKRLAALTEAGAKRARVGGRDVITVSGGKGGMNWAAWLEGKHLVVVGTLAPAASGVNRVLNAGAGITSGRLYKALVSRKGFEVTTRGFVDGRAVRGLAGWLKLVDSHLVASLEDWGVLDIEAVRIWEGFDGKASRSLWEIDLTAKRHTVSRFLVNKPLDLKSLPPVPDDAYRWTAGRANMPALYDLLLTFGATVSGGPGATGKSYAEVKEQMRDDVEKAFGIDPKDLFGSLGDTFLTHASQSDGLFLMGQGLAVSVKDEKKLTRSLDAVMKRFSAATRGELEFRREKFHGATIREMATKRGISPGGPCYTIYKGWLVFALSPQAVRAHVLRVQGKLEKWKPDEATAKALAAIPKDAGLVQVADPRPIVKTWFAGAPIFMGIGFRFSREPFSFFQVGDLPHGGTVARHLYPNVSWTSFDGKTWRLESRGSVVLPMQGIGTEWAMLFGSISARFLF
jgi:hypothetical protein